MLIRLQRRTVERGAVNYHGSVKRLLLFALCAAALPAADRASVNELADRMRAQIVRFDARMEKDPTPSMRDVTNCALARLALNDDVKGAERMLRFFFEQQNMDEHSPTYGEVLWQVGHPEIKDANAIEFTAQPLGPLLLHYGAKLSPEVRTELERHVHAAFAALARHKVKVSYTNIYLMKTVSLILMGEAVRDEAAANSGYAQLKEWIEYTNRAGVQEFLSPTYYSVDLNSLNMGYLYAGRKGAHEQFGEILDYFWTDIAANFFPGRNDLAGPHSRDYEFLSGDGGLLLQMAIDGMRPMYPAALDFEKVYMLESALNRGYDPPQSIRALTALPRRVVSAKTMEDADRDRYTFLTPQFALGSTTGDHSPQDKLINLELATAKEGFPAITVVPDPLDEPYGKSKKPDRSGHNKPFHLPLHPTTVQEEGTLLLLLDLDLSKESDPSIATNFILPAGADEIRFGGERVRLKEGMAQMAVSGTVSGSVTGIREGNAAVAIRVFTGAVALKADAIGLKNHAARLVIEHTERTPHVRVGALVLAAECRDDAAFAALLKRAADAKIQDQADGHRWSVSASIGSLKLAAVRDLDHRAVVDRSVNGKRVATHPLVVNGRDVTIRSLMQ